MGGQKANIGTGKANIEDKFTPRTAAHVRKLLAAFGSRIVFGRSDVQSVLGLKPTRSSALLREMAECGVTEPVSGRGKGKYRFRQQEAELISPNLYDDTNGSGNLRDHDITSDIAAKSSKRA
mgnify:CR=1 FL=1